MCVEMDVMLINR